MAKLRRKNATNSKRNRILSYSHNKYELKDQDVVELKKVCDLHGIDSDVLLGKVCPYCKSKTEYVDSERVYGKSYGMIYMCVPCDAYVGVHYGTSTLSKGSVAKKRLREWRKKAHEAFDPIAFEQKKGWSRRKAYYWLSQQMNLPYELTHIGMFSVKKCQEVIKICHEYQSRRSANDSKVS
jgi:hypothetical protein